MNEMGDGKMSDTPRTEAFVKDEMGVDDGLVYTDFARQLERELAEANAKIQSQKEHIAAHVHGKGKHNEQIAYMAKERDEAITYAKECTEALRAFVEQYSKMGGFPTITGPFVGAFVAAKAALENAPSGRAREEDGFCEECGFLIEVGNPRLGHAKSCKRGVPDKDSAP